MENRIKYIIAAVSAAIFMASAYFFPAETFLTFTVGWLFFIPAAFIVYMVWGFLTYNKESKHRIVVTIEPTEAMRSIARREAELKKEREMLYKEELNKLR